MMIDPSLPLAGVRVVELGRFMAAPWCGQILADLGAEVVKVERPDGGDQFRDYGPHFLKDEKGNQTAESAYFLSTNRNKTSILADFTTQEGKARILDEIGRSDILIENFKAGDLARFGLDHESLKASHPGLIYCSISGFGQSGPYANRPGLDSVFQAMSGMMSVTGEPDGPPQKVGVVIVDQITGLYAAIAIQAALRHREVNGGSGQHIDLALLDCAIAMMSHRAQDYLLSGEIPQRSGSASIGVAPAQLFQCADGYINVQAGDNRGFLALCGVLGLSQLVDDPDFASRTRRWEARDRLLPILERAFLRFTMAELFDAFTEAGVICAPVYDVAQALADRHVIERGIVWDLDHPLGSLRTIGNPIHFSKTPLTRRDPPPMLDQPKDVGGEPAQGR